ncbi:MAG: class I SAM-dependent methyltransferase [Acidobacteriota bacterium]|nr:methyltransferase domain-containing protein [Blastocatellia bacterium]MDW8411514.1 class I SAM-dependent methyltransferase [Acidobacteriota bacterium]
MSSNDLLNVRPVWESTARDYYAFISEPDSYVKQIEWPVITAMMPAARKVLDLGCGCGHYAICLTKAGAKVTALDISPAMLAIARSEAAKDGLEIDFREFDIRKKLPFDDATFDLVLSTTVLHYIEQLLPLFTEIARVMIKGGRLLLSVLHPISTSLFPVLEQDFLQNDSWNMKYFDSRCRHLFAPWSQQVPGNACAPPPIKCYHHTLEDYFSAIFAAGFQPVEVREPRPQPVLESMNPARFVYSSSQPLFLIIAAEKKF